jgi:hypothetical protein
MIDENLFAIWTSKLYHSNLVQLPYSELFQLCRSNSIGFDIRKTNGSLFTLLEISQVQHIGLMTIGRTWESTRKYFLKNLLTLEQEMTRKSQYDRSNFQVSS